MISIDSNKNIEVSRFDTFSIRFTFSDYTLTDNDKVVFAIKATTNSTETLYEASFYNSGESYVDVVVGKGELDNLEPGHYVYDLAIINDSTEQIITCFFTKAFTVKGVAHNV